MNTKSTERKKILVELTEATLQKAEEIARRERRSRKQILEFAVEQGLERINQYT